MAAAGTSVSERPLAVAQERARPLRRKGLRRFQEVTGEVRVEDAHVPAQRPAKTGMLLLPGEQVLALKGASYELLPAEHEFFDE